MAWPGSTNVRCMSTTRSAVRPRSRGSARLNVSCLSMGAASRSWLDYLLALDGGTPAPRRPAARTTIWNCSPRTAGPQPRDVLRLARLFGIARLGRRDPSPATSCGSHDYLELLALDGGAPAPRRPAARTTIWNCSPWTAGPQPRDVLRLARLFGIARLGRRGPSPATSCGSHYHGETEKALGMWRMAFTPPSSLMMTETTSKRHGICRRRLALR